MQQLNTKVPLWTNLDYSLSSCCFSDMIFFTCPYCWIVIFQREIEIYTFNAWTAPPDCMPHALHTIIIVITTTNTHESMRLNSSNSVEYYDNNNNKKVRNMKKHTKQEMQNTYEFRRPHSSRLPESFVLYRLRTSPSPGRAWRWIVHL